MKKALTKLRVDFILGRSLPFFFPSTFTFSQYDFQSFDSSNDPTVVPAVWYTPIFSAGILCECGCFVSELQVSLRDYRDGAWVGEWYNLTILHISSGALFSGNKMDVSKEYAFCFEDCNGIDSVRYRKIVIRHLVKFVLSSMQYLNAAKNIVKKRRYDGDKNIVGDFGNRCGIEQRGGLVGWNAGSWSEQGDGGDAPCVV